jgi:hypothetical protein
MWKSLSRIILYVVLVLVPLLLVTLYSPQPNVSIVYRIGRSRSVESAVKALRSVQR